MSRTTLAARSARWHMPLAVKLAVAFVALVAIVLFANGAVNFWLAFNAAKISAFRVQKEQASAAAEKISLSMADIERQIGWTTRPEWNRIPVEQQRYDFIRLLRQTQAVSEIRYINRDGREQLRLSRLEPDSIGSGQDFSTDASFTQAVAHKIYYGPVYFRRGSEPYFTISVAHVGPRPGVTSAEVNLKLISDVINAIHVGAKGYAYIVNAQGRLIAHPDISMVLRDTDLSKLPQVASAVAGKSEIVDANPTRTALGIEGTEVLTTHATIPLLGWLVFVQLPLDEALAPVYGALRQTALLLGLGVLFATLMGAFVARRIVAPITRLQQGAEQLGAGNLSQRIAIHTGDEIETLANRFNLMAEHLQDSYATLEAKVEDRTHELEVALQQQTATANVLKVISRSAFDLETVLDTLTQSAVTLCDADNGVIFCRDHEVYRVAASHGFSNAFIAHATAYPMSAGDGATIARVALSGETVQVADVLADPKFTATEYQRLGQIRSTLGVPLLREGEPVGIFLLTRSEVRPFTQRHADLVQTFADQAVIAIENVRLFQQLQDRTRDLAASLETLRLAQDRLVQSEKLASLGQLTAGIAHEIKNPLNFVNNFADLSVDLLDELTEAVSSAHMTETDEARAEITELTRMIQDNLRKIVHHGRRADSIVKNMLLHSRTGGSERQPVAVNDLAEEALNLAYHGKRAEDPGFNITLIRDYDPNAGQIEAFPQELNRVLLNLIGNGFYAAHKRALQEGQAFTPALRLSTQARGDSVEIRVRDNGTGISEAARAKIFEPFFTTKPAGEGTGLGLSLSYDIIVKQHAGRITVDSQINDFTEFTITLPRGFVSGDAS